MEAKITVIVFKMWIRSAIAQAVAFLKATLVHRVGRKTAKRWIQFEISLHLNWVQLEISFNLFAIIQQITVYLVVKLLQQINSH